MKKDSNDLQTVLKPNVFISKPNVFISKPDVFILKPDVFILKPDNTTFPARVKSDQHGKSSSDAETSPVLRY